MASIPCSSPPPATPSVVQSLPVPRLSVTSLEWWKNAPPMMPVLLEEAAAQADTSGEITLQQLRHGIVHIGVGAFHRGHLAVYIDRYLEYMATQQPTAPVTSSTSHDPSDDWRSWGICGVGLQASDTAMRDAVLPQDCLYSVTERAGDESTTRIVRCMTDYILGGAGNEEVVLAKLAARDTHIVSLTITEGGYYVTAATNELDVAHPNLAADLAAHTLDAPRSVYGYLAAGLARRRAAGLPPFTVLSCDNISGNGDIVRRMLLEFLRRRGADGAELAAWLTTAGVGAFPNSMVDRICPRTSEADISAFASRFRLADAWPVVCEPFAQFVIEDVFACGRPRWETVGVEMVRDVHPHETIKLRVLNASHSALCYLGHLAGYTYVHEVVTAPLFRTFLRRLMHEEVAPLLQPPAGVRLAEYIDSVAERFANATIADTLARICMQGSAKLPKFLLPSVEAAHAAMSPRRDHLLLLCVAAWLRYGTGVDEHGQAYAVDDVRADDLRAASLALQHYDSTASGDAAATAAVKERLGQVLPLSLNDALVARLATLLRQLHEQGAKRTLEATLERLDAAP